MTALSPHWSDTQASGAASWLLCSSHSHLSNRHRKSLVWIYRWPASQQLLAHHDGFVFGVDVQVLQNYYDVDVDRNSYIATGVAFYKKYCVKLCGNTRLASDDWSDCRCRL